MRNSPNTRALLLYCFYQQILKAKQYIKCPNSITVMINYSAILLINISYCLNGKEVIRSGRHDVCLLDILISVQPKSGLVHDE